jgi:hypothetical protein
MTFHTPPTAIVRLRNMTNRRKRWGHLRVKIGLIMPEEPQKTMGFLAGIATKCGATWDSHSLAIGRNSDTSTSRIKTPTVIATSKLAPKHTATREGSALVGTAIFSRHNPTVGISPKHKITAMKGDPNRLTLTKSRGERNSVPRVEKNH